MRPSVLTTALWLAFAVVVVSVSIVLLHACGLFGSIASWNFCPATPASLSAETERGAALRTLVQQLELDLAQKNLACASIPLAPPPALELPRQSGPPRPQQTAALKPPPPPPPPPKPEPPKAEPPSPVLKMPDKPTDDYSFMKGCWRTDAFQHTRNHPPGVSTYCFDERGNGQLEFRRADRPGYVCRAPARARFEGQQLRIRDSDSRCSDGSNWYADNLECAKGADNVAQCSGRADTPDGRHTWTVRLNRQ